MRRNGGKEVRKEEKEHISVILISNKSLLYLPASVLTR